MILRWYCLFAFTVILLFETANCDGIAEKENSNLVLLTTSTRTGTSTDHADTASEEALRYSPQGLDFGILAWIHNIEGGYYNPKQEFRTEDPNDPTSLTGVFAKERIENGELLCRVPSTHWIIGEPQENETPQLCCDLVRKLAHYMRPEVKSKFTRFIHYIHAQPENQIPSVWSIPAQELLLKVLGVTREENNKVSGEDHQISKLFPPSKMVTWIEDEWYGTCQGNRQDHLQRKAAVMCLLRADDDLLLPGYDFYNHRNGEWHNADSANDGQFYETRAWRTIEPGEQIFISYNRCPDCDGRTSGYGAAELFRDYGFIEDFPQHWHYYNNEIAFDLHHQENETYYEVEWISEPWGPRRNYLKFWLRQQVHRLHRLWHITYKSQTFKENNISKHEWDMIWAFHKANLVAMKCALHAMNGFKNQISTEIISTLATMDDFYHDFKSEDSWYAVDMEVPDWESEELDDYPFIDGESNMIQTIDISAADPPDTNICMYRDDNLHVCSSFRPAYYEYFVHPAASLLPIIRRVLIIGNGAAFLVHEVMKYTSTLELVVVIEPDQTVTLMAHKHFDVDPHFDDPRVHWWFGDINTLISLVPTRFVGSFDLVLLDIDRPSFPSFCKDEITFSDLVHNGGIFVSHNDHMDEMGKMFAYTSRLVYQSTTHSQQIHSLGSHSIDFLRAASKDHGIETLVYDTLVMSMNRLSLLHDFERSSIIAGPAVGINKKEDIYIDSISGVLTVVEFINMTNSMGPIALSLQDVLAKQNVSFCDNLQFSKAESTIFVKMKEGYIIIRGNELQNYIGLDVYIRQSISQVSALTTAIVESIGAPISSFRLFPGGEKECYPVTTDTEQYCNEMKSSYPLKPLNHLLVDMIVRAVWKTFVLSLVDVLVVCPTLSECSSRRLIKDLDFVGSVFELKLCPSLNEEEEEDGDGGSMLDSMLECDRYVQHWITSTLISKNRSIDVLIIDGGVSLRSLQVLDGILNVDSRSQNLWISDPNLLITLPTHLDLWIERRSFSDRFFHNWGQLDGVKADFVAYDSDGELLLDVGLGCQGMGDVRLEILDLEDKLIGAAAKWDSQIQIQRLRGGSIRHRDLLPMRPLEDGDCKVKYFDESKSTLPVGVQDFVRAFSRDGSPLDRTQLEGDILNALESTGMRHVQKVVFADNSMSSDVLAFEFDIGTIAIFLNENSTFDLNIYSNGDSQEFHDIIENFLVILLKEHARWALLSLTTIPRGPGKVMLFQSSDEEHDLGDESFDDEN